MQGIYSMSIPPIFMVKSIESSMQRQGCVGEATVFTYTVTPELHDRAEGQDFI